MPTDNVSHVDVIEHGFGARLAPITIRGIEKNIQKNTNKSTVKLVEIMNELLDREFIEPARSKCFVLTERAIQEHNTTSSFSGHQRVLDQFSNDGVLFADDVSASLNAGLAEIQPILDKLCEMGAIHYIGDELGQKAYVKEPMPLSRIQLNIRLCGPTVRRALLCFTVPIDAKTLGNRLNVTRERGRQIIDRLLDLQLIQRRNDVQTDLFIMSFPLSEEIVSAIERFPRTPIDPLN